MPRRKRKEWTAAQIALFGTITDAQLARRLGRMSEYVKKKRQALGIKAKSEYRWKATDVKLVGRGDDETIAVSSGAPFSP